ncbi:MAG: glycoside hydrolase family 2 TIM barrel-domain containing protein [Salinivirgaceae bacterium]
MYKILIISLLIISSLGLFAQPVKVEVKQVDGKWTLLRGGEPYYINGAGGKGNLKTLARVGGNSIRIWSADEAKEVLDEAHANGLTVMFGLWVQHERHGFDYNNKEAVKGQLEYFTEVVKKYKDHPALLLWTVGNEVDLFYTNFKVWDAVQDIAKMIKEIDPNHPISTVTAGLHEREVKMIKEKCPDIDIYGINTYSEACSIADNIRNWGWEKSYIISEWGPDGHWEVPKTKWNVPIEQTSHEKAIKYQERYRCIKDDAEMCIGSYVFLWGQKQETTATWYGLFTNKGEYTEVIDYVSHGWTGKWPENRAPSLDSIKVNDKKKDDDIYLIADEKYTATVFASDDHSDLNYQWEIFPESDDVKAGGDFENALDPVRGTIKRTKANLAHFRAPKKEGAYRIFVTVADKQGKVAYANVPFYVNPRGDEMPQSRPVMLKKRELNIDELK